MDVNFEPQEGRPFAIEVGFFDTVLEIKEKIMKYQGIPIHKQTLVFNNQVLEDDRDIESCGILQASRIQLLVASESDEPQEPQLSNDPEPSAPPSTAKIRLTVKMPYSKVAFPFQMDVTDTILHLKMMIHELETVEINRMVVQCGRTELKDDTSLGDCGLVDNSEIDVFIKPFARVYGTESTRRPKKPKKMRVVILSKCGTKKIPLEVNPSDNVGEIRKDLERLHQSYNFHLPEEGYFFIHNQSVMDDDVPFRLHGVKQGDTIEIFPGYVTKA